MLALIMPPPDIEIRQIKFSDSHHSFLNFLPTTLPLNRISDTTASPAEAVFLKQGDTIQLPLPPKIDESYKEPDEREGAFSVEQRFKVRYDQAFRCAACGKSCRGDHFDESFLMVHHVKPLSQGGTNHQENAIGLCPDDHIIFDTLALDFNLFPLPVTESMFKLHPRIHEIPGPVFRYRREEPVMELGHKHLRKGKKVKSPDERKRHQDRNRRNPDPRPVYQPRQEPVPMQQPPTEVFNLSMLSAD
jgi:hypothetical protein